MGRLGTTLNTLHDEKIMRNWLERMNDVSPNGAPPTLVILTNDFHMDGLVLPDPLRLFQGVFGLPFPRRFVRKHNFWVKMRDFVSPRKWGEKWAKTKRLEE